MLFILVTFLSFHLMGSHYIYKCMEGIPAFLLCFFSHLLLHLLLLLLRYSQNSNIFSIVDSSSSQLLSSYHVSIYIISPLLVVIVIRVASAAGTARNTAVDDRKDNNGRKGRHLEDEHCMMIKCRLDQIVCGHQLFQKDASSCVQEDGGNDAKRLVGPKEVIQGQDDYEGDADAP